MSPPSSIACPPRWRLSCTGCALFCAGARELACDVQVHSQIRQVIDERGDPRVELLLALTLPRVRHDVKKVQYPTRQVCASGHRYSYTHRRSPFSARQSRHGHACVRSREPPRMSPSRRPCTWAHARLDGRFHRISTNGSLLSYARLHDDISSRCRARSTEPGCLVERGGK